MNDICISVFLFWLTTSTPLFCGWNTSKTNLDIRGGGGWPANTVISGFDEEVADGGGCHGWWEGSLRVTSVTRVCGAETPRNLDTSIVQPVVFISYLTFDSWVHVTHVGLARVDTSCCSCEIMHDFNLTGMLLRLLTATSVKHIG